MRKLLNRYITIIDWYIIKKYLGTFIFTLLIVISISVVFDISEHMDNFLSHNNTVYDIAFKYYAGFIPYFMDLLSPLITFLAVIFFTAKMANQTEIVPILSGKASFNRFLRPYFISASVIFVVMFFAKLYLIPYTNNRKVKFENANGFNGEYNAKNEVHVQLDNRTFAYLQSYDKLSHTGYMFTLEQFDGDMMRRKIVANTVEYDSLKNKWSMRNYSVRNIYGLKETFIANVAKTDTVLDLKPSDFENYSNEYTAMSLSELNKRIDMERLRGTGYLQDMLYEKYRRYIYPFASYVLTLIGVSIASRKVRGGIGLPLGIGLFLCFAYIVVDKFALVFAIKSGLSPIIAVILPNGLFGLLGLYLLYRAPK